ncbi:MAG: serine/threonine protein kinase, partial [Planctomycetia bacterium]|nr:serine/threonine protein kinase [Planctomycetia bacterium]
MPRTSCLEETDFIALSLGEVAEPVLVEYIAHLETCAACERKVQQFDGLADSMISALRRPASSQAQQATNLIVKPAAATPRPGTVASLPTQGLGPPSGNGPPLAEPVEEEFPRIPGYEVLDVLGQGGMGIVYKARQDILNRIVALKMLLPGARMMGGSLSRFCQEAEAVARLQHPNLVQIFQIGLHDDQPFLALEFVDGGSLKDHMTGAPQTPRRAAELTETLARAIDVAHRHQIIHRDLKPANILMHLPDGPLQGDTTTTRTTRSAVCNLEYAVPKITDFGLAKQLDNDLQLTQEGVVAGTPCYMAPEQADSKFAKLGPTTDIYSLGVILYELLTGRVPLEGPSILDTLLLVRGQDPVPPRQLQPRIPADLETICLKCLEKQPAKRYPSALALADDLRRFLDGKPIVARPTPSWERAWKWARRQPMVAGLSAGIVAAVVLGFVGISWQWS